VLPLASPQPAAFAGLLAAYRPDSVLIPEGQEPLAVPAGYRAEAVGGLTILSAEQLADEPCIPT
jgi:hypothetical protein